MCTLSTSLSPGPTNPPNSGSACCAGRCHGVSIRLAFKFAHFERDQSRKKKCPKSTGIYGEKQKLHSINAHSISQLWLHSMQFMLGGPSWKSPCGYPKETSTCLMKVVQNLCRISCSQRTVTNSYPPTIPSVHAFPCM